MTSNSGTKEQLLIQTQTNSNDQALLDVIKLSKVAEFMFSQHINI